MYAVFPNFLIKLFAIYFSAIAGEMAVYHQITFDEVLEQETVPLWPEDRIAHPFKYANFHIDKYPSGYDDKEKNAR